MEELQNNHHHQSNATSEAISVDSSADRSFHESSAAADGGSPSHSFSEKIWTAWQAFCCLDPDDDFVQVLRKTSASVCVLMAPAPAIFGLYFGYSGFFPSDPDEPSNIGMKLAMFVLCAFGANGAAPYFYLRCWKGHHIPTVLMDINMVFHTFLACMTTIIWPGCMSNGLAITIAIVTILSQAKYVIAQCIVLIPVYFLDVFNKAYEGTSQELVISGARYGPHAEKLVVGVAVQACVTLAIIGVFAQSVAHVKHLSASRAAVEMSRQIVNLLRRYNTEGVTEALKHYNDDVDPDLVKSLKQMNDNLETYKPFLPNYLFQEDDFETATTTSEGAIVLDTTSASDFIDESSMDGSTSADSTQTPVSSMYSEHSIAFAVGSPKGAAVNTVAQHSGAKSTFEGLVSFATVEVPNLHNRCDAAKATSFVECVFEAAEVSKGSVHSLVGDVATITWNATHRVAQPELKATKFLHHLKKNQPMPFGAVVFSGSACCYSITSSKKQHANVISAVWMPMAKEAFRLACEHKSMLLDERTEAASCNYFTSIYVDCVALCSYGDEDATEEERSEYLPRGAAKRDRCNALLLAPELSDANGWTKSKNCPFSFSRATAVFQLLNEVIPDEQEWMYQLESKQDGSETRKRLREAATQVFVVLMEHVERNSKLSTRTASRTTQRIPSFVGDNQSIVAFADKQQQQATSSAAEVCQLIGMLVEAKQQDGFSGDCHNQMLHHHPIASRFLEQRRDSQDHSHEVHCRRRNSRNTQQPNEWSWSSSLIRRLDEHMGTMMARTYQ